MPVRVIAKRTGASGRVPATLSSRTPGVVGTSRGKSTQITNEAVVAGATSGTTGSALIDALAQSNVRGIVKIANVTGSTAETYRPNIDYVLTDDEIVWSGASLLPTPALETPTLGVATGGSWSVTGTCTFVVTAKDQAGTGETSGSDEQTYAIAATGNTVYLQWSKVPLAGGYNIYQKEFGGDYQLVSTIVGATTVSLTLTGATGDVSSAPVTNTAYRRPGAGSTYYCTYNYAVFSYEKKQYFNYSDVEADHGSGSALTRAARLAMVDNNCPAMYLCAVNGETVAAYQDAIDKLKTVDIQYITALKGGTAIEQYLRSHAEERSGDTVGKERIAVVSCPSGYTLGDTSTSGTAIYWAKSFGGSNRVIALIPNISRYYVNSWQATTGSYADGPVEVDSFYYSAAVAGKLCALEDSATPLTNAQLGGFTWPEGLSLWDDSSVKNLVEAAGGTYVMEEFGIHTVYHGVTCSLESVEDQEISVVVAEFELRKRLRDAVSGYRGRTRKVTSDRLRAISNTSRTVLAALVKSQVVESFGTVLSVQDADDPTLIYVRFEYAPIYPMNQIIFEYGFSVAPLTVAV